MAVTFNPFTGNLDFIDTTAAAGSDTEIQYNDNGKLAGDADLTWDTSGATSVLGVGGDINLDDGGTYETTLQVVTPTAARTISFPDATGTIGLVAGSSSQVVYNNAGAYAGTSTITYDGTNVTLSGRFISSLNGAASAPPGTFTGTWFTGGTSTTTKPQVLIEPTGATSTAWSTSGTGLGVNAASGFAGNLLDLQVNGSSSFLVTGSSCVARRSMFGSSNILTATDTAGTNLSFSITGSTSSFVSKLGITNAYFVPTSRLTFASIIGDASNNAPYLIHDNNTAIAQVGGPFRFYNVLGSNFERLGIRWVANEVILGAEAGGTGVLRGLKIGSANTNLLGFYGATPIVQPANTVAIDTLLVNTGLRASGGTAAFATDITRVGANGQETACRQLTELTTIAAAADTDTTIQIPAGAIVIGVTVRVTTVIPTAATFDVGIAGTLTKFGTGISTAATTTNVGSITPELNASAVSIRITPNLTPADNTGRVRVTIHYMQLTAATS